LPAFADFPGAMELEMELNEDRYAIINRACREAFRGATTIATSLPTARDISRTDRVRILIADRARAPRT
jgi:hypothetical protein